MSSFYVAVACLDEQLVRTKKASMKGNRSPLTQDAHKPICGLGRFGHFQGRGSIFAAMAIRKQVG